MTRQRWQRNPAPVRLLQRLMRLRIWPLVRVLRTILGIDIGKTWPAGLILPHPYCVVIHADAELGDSCVVYQGVTIGADSVGRVPCLGDRVVVYPGACIIGNVHIGDGVIVGANSVVRTDVPSGCVVAGVPARIVSGKD